MTNTSLQTTLRSCVHVCTQQS